MYMLYIWLAVFVLGLIIELIDAGTLVSMWFSVGAVIPFVMSCWRIDSPWYITAQVIVFGVVTALCLIFLRKVALKVLFKNNKYKTNMDQYVGKKLKVLSVDEDGEKFIVKLNGIEYNAMAEKEDIKFELKEEVEVVRFEGNKIIIRKVK